MTYRERFDRVAHMNAGRGRALERRNNGGGARVIHRTTGGPEAGSISRIVAVARCEFQSALAEFIEEARFRNIGDQWEGFF